MAAGKQLRWKVVSLASGALAGLTTQRLLELGWRSVRRSGPPPVPADRRSSWTDAITWAVASGVGVAVARLLAVRSAALVWEAATHELPPDPGIEARQAS